MPRYIDADAFMNKFYNGTPPLGVPQSYQDGWNDALAEVVYNAQTADVQGVKHGRWVMTENPNFSPFDRSLGRISNCSECSYQVEQYDYKFCPHCGAKMDFDMEVKK